MVRATPGSRSPLARNYLQNTHAQMPAVMKRGVSNLLPVAHYRCAILLDYCWIIVVVEALL